MATNPKTLPNNFTEVFPVPFKPTTLDLECIAELVNATAGLGYRIVRAQRFLQSDRIFAVLVVIGLAGVTIDIALRLLRSRVGGWAG